jgi:hypothetical protein
MHFPINICATMGFHICVHRCSSAVSNCQGSFFTEPRRSSNRLIPGASECCGRNPATMRTWGRAAWGFHESCFGNLSCQEINIYIAINIRRPCNDNQPQRVRRAQRVVVFTLCPLRTLWFFNFDLQQLAP